MKLQDFIRNKSINRISLLGMFSGALFIIIFAALVILQEYVRYRSDITQLEKTYLASQKKLIADETNRALRYIAYKHTHALPDKPPELIQKEIVDAIEQMRDERDGTGYVFIYTFDGINIADPILTQNAGKNLINFADINGKKVIHELIKVSKQPEGGYVDYVWNKPTTHLPAAKISYAKAYAPWKWMVGSGVYLDSVQEIIKQRKSAHAQRMIDFSLSVLIGAMILFVIISTFSNKITSLIRHEIAQFIYFFDGAAQRHENIQTDQLLFTEFQAISRYANAMVDEIHEKTQELQNLNKNLEHKVEEKTLQLRQKAEDLSRVIQSQDKFIKHSIHEIYTPLNIIFANIELLERKFEEHKNLSNITAAAKTIHNIYNDLSYMIKKDRTEYKSELINLSQFLLERIDYFAQIAHGNGLRITPHIESDLYVRMNETELQRLCDNNLSNAIKYSHEDATIQVSLTQQDAHLLLNFTNQGPAIQNPAKLFDAYYRENDSRGGFGLGLSIVKEICDKKRIIISATSENGSTTFRYLFPPLDQKDINENSPA